MAAEIETIYDEGSDLIQGSGGIFEVVRDGELIFSKKEVNRFPEDGEVVAICKLVDDGMPMDQAKAEAGKHAQKHPSFGEWLQNLFKK